MKLIEAGLLLLAGVLFAWWQLRDVRLAQEESARKRKDAQETAASPEPKEPA